MPYRVAVVGSGIMGTTIALSCALGRCLVRLWDNDPGRYEWSRTVIAAQLEVLKEEGVLDEELARRAAQQVQFVSELVKAVDTADIVVEAISEDLKAKQELFVALEELAPREALLTSNSSTYPISRIAEHIPSKERAYGFHWYNPAHLIPLVEVIPHGGSLPEGVENLKEFARSLGKVPVVCKESPGFLGVRLQAALVTEALRILDEGLASPEDIDQAVRLSFGLRLALFGPLSVVDFGGLDTFCYAYEFLAEALGDRFRAPEVLRRYVEEGRLGVKTGRGFFEYFDCDPAVLSRERDRRLIGLLKHLGMGVTPV